MSSCSLEMKLYPRIDRIWLIAMMQSDRVIEIQKVWLVSVAHLKYGTMRQEEWHIAFYIPLL